MNERLHSAEPETQHELQFGETFFPFDGINLPERVSAWMLSTEVVGSDPDEWNDEFIKNFPSYKFAIEGISGKIILYGDRVRLEKTELPLGEVRKNIVYKTPVIDGIASDMEEYVDSIPLGLAVGLRANSPDDARKIQWTRLRITVGERKYDIRMNGLIDYILGCESEEDPTQNPRDILWKIIEEEDGFVATENTHDSYNDDNERVSVLFPYDKLAIEGIGVTFFNDVVPEQPFT